MATLFGGLCFVALPVYKKQSRDVPCVDNVIMMHTRHKHPGTTRKVKRFPFHIEKLQKLDASQVFKRVQIQHQS
jgi:hypothetical protein